MKKARFFENISALLHSQETAAPLEDPQAFSALYERSCRSVYRYLYGLHGGPSEDVEDLTTETFYRAWKARRSFSGDPHSAATGWLLRIARRLVIDAYRHSQARIQPQDAPLEDIPQLGPAPENLALQNEQYEILWGLLRRLPDEQREMLVLRYLLGWRIREVADFLEIPENTVSVAIHRALGRLQRDWPQDKEAENAG